MTLISVIITTKNEEKHVTACLKSLASQSFSNFETIVVDNHSSDKTKEIARQFTHLVFTAGPERSAQRNFGAQKAKGEYILFLDADMMLESNVLEECIKNVRKYSALIIPEKSIGVGFWSKCKILERSCYEDVQWMEAARFYRRNMFDSLGGYDENLTGPEDFELSQRLRVQSGRSAIGRIQSHIFHDEGNLRLGSLLRKKYYYGKKMYRYRNLPESKKYFDKQSNVFARYVLFASHPKMFITDPVHAIGMLFMKTLEMIALGVGGLGR